MILSCLKQTGLSYFLLVCLLFIGLDTKPCLAQEKKNQAAEELFANRVLATFRAKCFSCHGDDPKEIRGEYNMLTREGLLKGGESEEAAVIPGKPQESPLVSAIKWVDYEMPPKENDRLTKDQIAEIEQWITGGAPWPDEKRIAELIRTTGDKWNAKDGVKIKTSGGLAAEWTNRRYKPENLWAYQPLWKDEQGTLKSDHKNPIDILIEKQTSELKLPLAPLADRKTLIRRATFDLLGLPATPEEIAAFETDPATDEIAFKKVIERLLASPHYGEQWGRHWLDVVRYADSSGYANDFERGSAWRYRDYVVRSFNKDLPYDQFIKEQIAGDELNERDPEMLVSAGFLRMGPWELTSMEVPKIARQRFLDDVTASVGQVFLGQMLQCCKCHDHKFDPLPTQDYYSIQAVFATTQLVDRKAAFLPEENTEGFEEKKYLDQRRAFYSKAIHEVNSKRTIEAARKWYADNKLDASKFEAVIADMEKKNPKAKVTVQRVRSALESQKVHPDLIPPRHVGFGANEFGMERVARKGQQRMVWRMERYQPYALSVYNGHTPKMTSVTKPLRMPSNLKNGELENTAILVGGDPFSPSQSVKPSVVSVVNYQMLANSKNKPEQTFALTEKISGRRTGLANWIASKENPLTARVMANRIWQWHFGQAIAGNPNNFGATGKKPTHPQLLDFLASQFMKNGWSVKSMHRLIMTSEAYRRGSDHPDLKALAEKDPLGTSYAVFKPRRLDAEELRDAMLKVSGEINLKLGGIPIRPEMNYEAAMQPRMVMGSFAEAWQPSIKPEQRHRRSLYALKIRGHRDPFYEVFNAPGSEFSCEAREASTVTPQVFAMFNSQITFDRSLALANRVLTEKQTKERSDEEIVQRTFQLVYGRLANETELKASLAHWKKMTKQHQSLNFEPPTYPQAVVREAIEENTGENFTFLEPLEFYQDFVPDLKPSDVGPRVRGLAELCLVLLNSNEFAYVY